MHYEKHYWHPLYAANKNSGFNHEDSWGHRAPEPNKAVICSLALAKLRTDIRGDMNNNPSAGMAQKLLLFWIKPARRCWWEGIDLEGVEGVEGTLKVWIRRVWTLEMVSTLSIFYVEIRLIWSTERHWIEVMIYITVKLHIK